MYFALLPPEINSGRMYCGPGPGPLLSAATAWDGLATELDTTASGYASVISGLTGGPWLGPSAQAMAAAVTPFVAWLQATAPQCAQAGAQAKAAAAAFEAAFAATVPPPVIAANRALLMTLVATNFLGQNTPAIAATEAHYAQMWAQDAAAMTGYAGASAAAAVLTPFTPPPATAHPAGVLGSGGGVAQALGGLGASTPSATGLSSLVSPGLSPSSVVDAFSVLESPLLAVRIATTPVTYAVSAFGGRNVGNIAEGLAALGNKLGSIPGGLGTLMPGGLGALMPGGLGAATPAVTAGLGQASTVGALSVPSRWAAPTAAPAAATLTGTSWSTAPAVAAGGAAMPHLPVAGMSVPAADAAPGNASRFGLRPVSVIPHFREVG